LVEAKRIRVGREVKCVQYELSLIAKKDRTWVWGVLIGLPQAQRDEGRGVGQGHRTQDEQRQTSDGCKMSSNRQEKKDFSKRASEGVAFVGEH